AELAQRAGCEPPHRLFILEHQDDLAGTEGGLMQRRPVRPAISLPPRRASMARQVDAHAGALADFALHGQIAAGSPGEVADGAEAEAGAFSRSLGREEGLTRPRQHLRAHADAGIGDLEYR